jgi:RNA polymerase sigma factor (sigma-70 family)
LKNVIKDRDHWLEVTHRFRSGDRAAFGEIYSGFIDSLLSYGLKITRDHELVKDCIQDIFVNLHKLNPNLHHPEYIEFYLFRSLKNAVNYKFQENKKLEVHPIEEIAAFELRYNIEQEIDDPESDRLRVEKLKRILQTLDPQKRELLFLKFSTGLNYVEIGQLLDMNPDTVKKQVYRTLDHLRGKYGTQLMELLMIWVKVDRR